MRFIIVLIGILVIPVLIYGQVSSIPEFPTENDSIIVIFNAAEGNQGLMGYTGDDVYAHTGVITNYSTSPSDWKHVVAAWNENIAKAKLTRIGTDLWQLVIGFPRKYYNLTDPNERILQLAFVFRNSTASVTGRATGGEDIFLDLFEPGLTMVIIEPAVILKFGDPQRTPVFAGQNDSVRISITAAAIGTQIDSLFLSVEDTPVAETGEDTLHFDFWAADFNTGMNRLTTIGRDTAGISDTTEFFIMINPPVVDAAPPPGVQDGINYIGNNTVVLKLYAPYKNFVYIIGDFTDWKVDENFYMNRYQVATDSIVWWLQIDGLNPGEEYSFQYLVDGELRIADPYSEKVLDPWNDSFIGSSTYPDLKPYPHGNTEHVVGILQTAQTPFQWVYTDTFQRPEKHKLVIYELLVRDFIAAHNYQILQDTLDYLQNLGVNAIELMPVMEFEGNISWGYNPSFYFAPDKYYGPAEELKKFIDECHRRGMAVILDMVLNHAFGQNSMVRLYWDAAADRPAANSPWFNQVPKHDFNVGYDFNHESPATQYLVDRVNAYWLQEFRFDGYRFDLSKGFTQKNTLGNVGLWGQYDQSRIDLLNRMANKIWEVDSTAYVILEHFADNSEEKVLSAAGMMLWGNLNYNYNEATMGYHDNNKSDFSWGYYGTRGWAEPHLVTYMESHDEERLMYKNLQYGNSSGSYNIKNLHTALNRVKMTAAFFFTYPGPKMIWQFGELGYDVSIDYNGRTGPKPIRWNYFQNEDRRNLYKTFAALLKLRNENEAFTDSASQVSMQLQGAVKRLRISHSSLNATIIGNFDVVERSIAPNFQSAGMWYNYFMGDSLEVANPNASITLAPGEFHIFTDKKLPTPEEDILSGFEEIAGNFPQSFELHQNYPNPFNPETTIEFTIDRSGLVGLKIFNILGQEVKTLLEQPLTRGSYRMQWDGTNQQNEPVSSGIYILQLKSGERLQTRRMILLR